MSEFVTLKADDGNELSAYVARPEGTPKGAVVVVQEIFGVNSHIRSIAEGYAKEGYVAIAPALFDRIEKGVELKYEGEDLQKAFGFYQKLDPKTALMDVAAGYKFVEAEDHKGIAVVGFCFGGFMAWLAATRGEELKMQPSCTVGYYAGGIGSVAKEEPSCPVLLHFGANDSHIGPEQIEAVREAHPEVTIYVYEGAEHGFNCDQRGSYNPEAAKLARERTLEFLRTHIA
jgi:carboxymethylenebutenolidase